MRPGAPGWRQPDDPNATGTSMVWAAAHAAPPRGSCHTASLVRWTARASHPPAGPGASVTVPGGSAGSCDHEPAGPVMVCAWFPVSTTATLPPGPDDAEVSLAPCSGSGGDRAQWVPPPVDQAASRRVAVPEPAASRAMVVPAVVVSRSTVTR